MDESEINYKILRKIQEMEKNSPVLTNLNKDFYLNLTNYLENLNNRLEGESSSQKQILLKDEIQNTKKIVVNIYEQREKKIILAAISKARGGAPELKNMIDVEKNLFDSVLNLMENSRKQFLEGNFAEKKISLTKKIKTEEEVTKSVLNQNNTNPIVRVKEDMPEFIGTNEKKYNLRKNDILSLPEDMSNMLSKRGVVEKIKEQ